MVVDQLDLLHLVDGAVAVWTEVEGEDVDLEPLVPEAPADVADDPRPAGPKAWDEYTGLPLDPKLVANSRREDIQFMEALGVWVFRPRSEAIERTGRPPMGTRWVGCNKG